MRRRVRILTYNIGCSGPREIKDLLPQHRIKRITEATTWYPKPWDVLINWGCPRFPVNWLQLPKYMPLQWLNHPNEIARSHNKILALQTMKEGGVNVPEFTTDLGVAVRWFNEGHTVVRRGTTTGHSGAGITLHNAKDGQSCPTAAPLFTRYQPKKREFRLHVFGGRIIDAQEKRKRSDMPAEAVDFQIRSHANGWNFCREGVSAPSSVSELALNAVSVLSLDFGAVDIGWNEKHQLATVYEVNSAPGVEGTTAQKYAEAVNAYLTSR